MLFGLSSAPCKFAKLLKPIVAVLHRQGITLVIYIDGLWITALTFAACLRSMFVAARLLTRVGFLLNKKKSHPKLKQQVVALGYVVDSVSMTIALSLKKEDDLISHCLQLLHASAPSICYVVHVLGKLISCFPVLPLGQAHYRTLEHDKVTALYIHHCLISDDSRMDLE